MFTVSGQQFCKESIKLQTRIIFERCYSVFHYCLLACRYVMLQKSILSKPKWVEQAVVWGARSPPYPPPPPPSRRDCTGVSYEDSLETG